MADAEQETFEHERRLAALEAELAQLHRRLDSPAATDRPLLGPLDRRPDIVRFFESRPGWLLLSIVQHGIWAVRSRIQRLRSRRPGPSGPVLTSPGAESQGFKEPAPASASRAFPDISVAIELGHEETQIRRLSPDIVADLPAPDPAAEPPPAPLPNLSAIPFDPRIIQHRPRLLIDVTPTSRLAFFTGGIARVARQLSEAGAVTGLALPVRIVEGALQPYYQHALFPGPIVPMSDDIYVICDVFWFFLSEYKAIIQSIHAAGARVALIVHDIGGIRFPMLFPEEMPSLFRTGLLELLRQSNFCIGVSKHVEDDVRNYLQEIGFPSRERLRFGHFLLGVGKAPMGESRVRATIAETFAGGHTFLSVGTLEPRKGYVVTLDACDLAWLSGAAFVMVLIGRFGWSAENLVARIETHPELNRRLFWFKDANDAELAFAYAHCRSLIQSSLDEGFCLPVSEACLFGAPIIASDLPVIREIAGTSVVYYQPGSHEHLAKCINEALIEPPLPPKFPLRSWCDSLRALSDCFSDVVPPEVARLPAAPVSSGEGPIHVACCFDDALAMPASVLAASVSATMCDVPVVFHLVRAPGLEADFTGLRAAIETPLFDIVEHVANGDMSGLFRSGQYSEAVYFRLMLPDLIDGDRVIYLDSDTMVRHSLLDLWRLDLQGHPIAATVDYLSLTHGNGDGTPIGYRGEAMSVEAYCRDIVGVDLLTTPYFNSGVMVMDLNAWRRTHLAARCRTECRSSRELNFVDQDALNGVLQGDFLPLDQRWNAFVFLGREYWPTEEDDQPSILGSYRHVLRPPSGDLQAALRAWANDPWIVHFAARSKPWRAGDCRTPFHEEFWQHAFRTPFGAKLHMQFSQTA